MSNAESGPIETTVAPATREDMTELIDIVGDPEDQEYMMEVQEKGKGILFVAKEKDKIVGVVLLQSEYQSEYKTDINGNFFAGMIVREDCRRRGVGGELLSACEGEARESMGGNITLAVSKSNDSAIAFYEKHGYTKIPDSDYIVTDEGGEGSEGEENFYMRKKFQA